MAYERSAAHKKLLPSDARQHNRRLVLQALIGGGQQSRSDLARVTGLTRVTTTDLVAELVADGIVRHVGLREETRPGKPAMLVELDPDSSYVLALDLAAIIATESGAPAFSPTTPTSPHWQNAASPERAPT